MIPALVVLSLLSSEPPRQSVTVGVLAPPLFTLLLNTQGTFVEYQTGVHEHFSVLGEVGYLGSGSFRTLAGENTGLRLKLATFCVGAAWWYRRPLDGPFISVRVEVWLASAQNEQGVAAIGNPLDANFQPGWQWQFGSLTVIASLSLAYVQGPIRSPDGTVEFPIKGASGTPHVRVGYVW